MVRCLFRVRYLMLMRLWVRLATADKFFMLPDSTSVVSPEARGRDSNRISSKWAYDESVIIIDLEHMPHGCATWPAYWTLSQRGPWPTGGEIDIIEVIVVALALISFC